MPLSLLDANSILTVAMPFISGFPSFCARGESRGLAGGIRGFTGQFRFGAADRACLSPRCRPIQTALAEATQTDKRTAGVFLDTLGALAYKEIKKNGEFVLPGFGKLVKQKRKARTGFNPKTQQKIKIPAKTVVKLRVAKAAKDGVLGVKK